MSCFFFLHRRSVNLLHRIVLAFNSFLFGPTGNIRLMRSNSLLTIPRLTYSVFWWDSAALASLHPLLLNTFERPVRRADLPLMSDSPTLRLFATEEKKYSSIRIGFGHQVVCDCYSLNSSTSKSSPSHFLPPPLAGFSVIVRSTLMKVCSVLLLTSMWPLSDQSLFLPIGGGH